MKAHPLDLHALMPRGGLEIHFNLRKHENAHDKETKKSLLFFLVRSRIMTQHETFMMWISEYIFSYLDFVNTRASIAYKFLH